MSVNINPAIQRAIDKVKTAGLHEVAKKEHGLKTLNAKTAATTLGSLLLYNHAKYARVLDGLQSLDRVYADPLSPTVKEAFSSKKSALWPVLTHNLLLGAGGSVKTAMQPSTRAALSAVFPPEAIASEAPDAIRSMLTSLRKMPPAVPAAAKPGSEAKGAILDAIRMSQSGLGGVKTAVFDKLAGPPPIPAAARKAISELAGTAGSADTRAALKQIYGMTPPGSSKATFGVPIGRPSPFSGQTGKGLDLEALRKANEAYAPGRSASRSVWLRHQGMPAGASLAHENRVMDTLIAGGHLG